MQKHLFITLLLLLNALWLLAQEAFVINHYDVKMHLTRDAVIEVTETIDLTFTEKRHGIIRKIPFRYYAAGGGEALRPFQSTGNEIKIFITNIDVPDWAYQLSKNGDYEEIRIGSENKYVNGQQRYVIKYKVYNAINFFEARSELYWNIIGQEWATQIEDASFEISWDEPIPYGFQTDFFIATGAYGSVAQDAELQFGGNRNSLSGKTTRVLQANEGMTVGIAFPKDFLQQTPIPPEVMAEKFYIKHQEVNIKVLQSGISEVTERYTIVPVRRMNSVTRFLYRYVSGQPSSFVDWMGDQSHYLITKVKFKGSKKCRSYQSNSVCFDISDIPVGEERTIEISYRTYGNFVKLENTPEGLLSFAYVPFNKGIDEPVLKNQVRIELPDGEVQDAIFDAAIQNETGFVNKVNVQQVNNHTFITNLGTEKPFMMSEEKLIFNLAVPESYFTKKIWSYEARLFWLNNRFLFLPLLVFGVLYYLWSRWGKDEEFSKMVHYYPPDNLPPSEAGILIDDRLHDRDLLALIPYWGAKGYIEIEEVGTDSFWKKDDYIFKMLKKIPGDVPAYEKIMFEGIFGLSSEPGREVKLSSLKDKFYTTMDKARKWLEKEVKRKSFYVPYTRGAGVFMVVLGIIAVVFGVILFVLAKLGAEDLTSPEFGTGLFATGVLSFIFGRIMPKKAPIGLEAYKKLAGFELFVKDAELPRLETFLKEDPHYFDKTLPYAIVFDHVEKWSKKFEALSTPPPGWYHSPRQDTFSAWVFTNHLSSAMRDMGNTFASRPSSSGSGSSFGGGGGFSGGGFGGGGGSSW